jgi:hypothetical protein
VLWGLQETASDRQHCRCAVLWLVLVAGAASAACSCGHSVMAGAEATAWLGLWSHCGVVTCRNPGVCDVGRYVSVFVHVHSFLCLVCGYASRLQATCQPLTLAGQQGSCTYTAHKVCPRYGHSAQPRRELVMCCRFDSAGLEGSTGRHIAAGWLRAKTCMSSIEHAQRRAVLNVVAVWFRCGHSTVCQ